MNEIVLIKDLGMRYPTENSKQKTRYGIYRCFCGNTFEKIMNNINKGNTKSCGCIKDAHKIKHNLSSNRLYGTWKGMIQRCTHTNHRHYNSYGGRGITVCDRWMSVSNFIEDMSSTYKDGLTLDRINPEGNYEPSNCRWSTKEVQHRNTRAIYSNNTSGYRCVYFNKKINKWIARIMVDKTRIQLGYFNTAIEGAKAYNKYVIANGLEHTLNIIKEIK